MNVEDFLACIRRNSYLVTTAITAAVCVIIGWIYLLRNTNQNFVSNVSRNEKETEEEVEPLLKYSDEDKRLDRDLTQELDKLKSTESMYKSIQRKVKSARLQTNAIEKKMTSDERQQERKIKEQQLTEIFKLMEEKKEVFGVESLDDMRKQMGLYDTST